jgi:hypothetical protein
MMSESTKRDERGRQIKSCVVCGREGTAGFDKLETRVTRWENGKRTTLPSSKWVCRPGFGCEGVGPVHFAFWNEPEGGEV